MTAEHLYCLSLPTGVLWGIVVDLSGLRGDARISIMERPARPSCYQVSSGAGLQTCGGLQSANM